MELGFEFGDLNLALFVILDLFIESLFVLAKFVLVEGEVAGSDEADVLFLLVFIFVAVLDLLEQFYFGL